MLHGIIYIEIDLIGPLMTSNGWKDTITFSRLWMYCRGYTLLRALKTKTMEEHFGQSFVNMDLQKYFNQTMEPSLLIN